MEAADRDGLSDEFRVVAWDAPGAGRSSDPPETSRLSDWAHRLAEFMEALEVVPAHVVGLSFGEGLALELFRHHPEVVRSLILMSAYAGWGGSLPAEEVRQRLELTWRNTELPPEQWVPTLIDTLLPEGSGAALADELATMLADFHPAATRTALRAFAEADLSDTLAEVDVPTLLLYGALDVRSPRDVWEPIHEGIAASRLVVVSGVGHMVDMQGPERCNALDPRLRATGRELPASRMTTGTLGEFRGRSPTPPTALPDSQAPCVFSSTTTCHPTLPCPASSRQPAVSGAGESRCHRSSLR